MQILYGNSTRSLHRTSLLLGLVMRPSAFLIFWVRLEIRGQQGDPPPSIKISLLPENQRPKWKIGRVASLDIILKISHSIFCTNQIITKGRKLPNVFEYSKLFLQLRTWYRLLDSLEIVKNVQLIHCNCLNNVLYSEPTFQAPQLYLLRHTMSKLFPTKLEKLWFSHWG